MDNIVIDIAIIAAVTEAIKRATKIPSRFVPLVSIAVSIGLIFLDEGVSTASALGGLIFGLSASGLYSSGKALIGR